jgi:hypothetical protein
MNLRIKILYLKKNKKKKDLHSTKSQLSQIKCLPMDLYLVCPIRTIKLKEFFLIIYLIIKQTLKLILFKIRLNLIQIFLQINQKLQIILMVIIH